MTNPPVAPAAFDDMTEAMALPRLVRIGDNLYAAVFNLMKLLPAKHIIERARQEGALAPGAPQLAVPPHVRLHTCQQLTETERFGQKINRAVLKRRYRELLVRRGGDQDHRDVRPPLLLV
jgi:hypothetical protein